MYSQLTKGLAVLFFATATLIACKKDKDKSSTDILTEGVWKIDISGEDINSNGVIDADENEVEACEQDDTYQFKYDHTMTLSDNADKCSSGDEQYSWELWDNDQKLILDTDTFTIRTLNDHQLEIFGVYPGGTKQLHKWKR